MSLKIFFALIATAEASIQALAYELMSSLSVSDNDFSWWKTPKDDFEKICKPKVFDFFDKASDLDCDSSDIPTFWDQKSNFIVRATRNYDCDFMVSKISIVCRGDFVEDIRLGLSSVFNPNLKTFTDFLTNKPETKSITIPFKSLVLAILKHYKKDNDRKLLTGFEVIFGATKSKESSWHTITCSKGTSKEVETLGFKRSVIGFVATTTLDGLLMDIKPRYNEIVKKSFFGALIPQEYLKSVEKLKVNSQQSKVSIIKTTIGNEMLDKMDLNFSHNEILGEWRLKYIRIFHSDICISGFEVGIKDTYFGRSLIQQRKGVDNSNDVESVILELNANEYPLLISYAYDSENKFLKGIRIFLSNGTFFETKFMASLTNPNPKDKLFQSVLPSSDSIIGFFGSFQNECIGKIGLIISRSMA